MIQSIHIRPEGQQNNSGTYVDINDYKFLESIGLGGFWFGLLWVAWKFITPLIKTGTAHGSLASTVYEQAASTIARLESRVTALEAERYDYIKRIECLERALIEHGVDISNVGK